jgi:transposase-like protein
MNNSEMKCPHCGSTDVGRSHRRFFERLLFGLRPFRCHTCLRRFLKRSSEREAA